MLAGPGLAPLASAAMPASTRSCAYRVGDTYVAHTAQLLTDPSVQGRASLLRASPPSPSPGSHCRRTSAAAQATVWPPAVT